MSDIVSADRSNIVNAGVVTDSASQSKSTLSSMSSAATERKGVLGGKPAAVKPANLRNAAPQGGAGSASAQSAPASRVGTAVDVEHAPDIGKRASGNGAGHPHGVSAGKPSPTVKGVFKANIGNAVAGATADELDDTPEFEGVGSLRDKSVAAKRTISRVRRRTAAKSAGAHGATSAKAKSTADNAAGAARTGSSSQAAARTAAAANTAGAQVQAAAAAESAASTSALGTAVSSAAAPVAGVIGGILAFAIGVLIVSQLLSAIFGFWENESSKGTGALTGVEQEIAAALNEYGFSNEATAAILGNLKAESGMDPSSDENMDGMFNYAYERACGIFQYTSTSPGTGEYWSFKHWCSSTGKTWSSVASQMEWTFSESGGGNWASRWGTALARSGYYSNCPGYTDGSFYQASEFKGADDVVKATFSWMACYEMPANGQYAHLDRRIEYAKSYLDKLTSTTTYSGSNKIVAAAYSQLGVPYVWGGSTPGVGLDCSGLTQYCYAQAGVGIAHYTETQYEQLTKVPISQAQPGDILYRYGHVAIYIGDDKYIHEPQTGDVCKISTGAGYFSCALRYTK